MIFRRWGWIALCALGCSSPRATPDANWDPRRFEELRARYMEALDDRAPDELQIALALERDLAGDVEAVQKKIAAGTLADGEKGAAGLVFIYDALLISRDTQHVEQGRIEAKRFYHGDALAEGRARREQVVTLLAAAQKLRPGDGRIASWIAGSEALAARDEKGELTDGGKQKLLAAIDVEPTFNLWTAFIVMRHEPLETPASQALFGKTREFIDSKKCREVQPGSADERNCRSGARAPHNTQAATVMLGDQYLRRGEAALRRGAIPEAMPLLGTARGIYGTLAGEKLKESTAAWRHAAHLQARLARLDQLKPGAPLPDEEFWKSRQFDEVYDCASCHAK
jgi:hypothetical protein